MKLAPLSTGAPSLKSLIRKEKIALRRGVEPSFADSAATRAAEHALQLMIHPERLTVSLYMPVRGEIDTRPLARRLREKGAALALPHVVGEDVAMVFRNWRTDDPLNQGFGKIPEPEADAPEVVPDIVIVPLSAFDRRGFRIGYGAGHYDRTLGPLARHERPLMIGYAFALQEVEEVPRELHDVPLDAVVTEDEIIRCNLGREGL